MPSFVFSSMLASLVFAGVSWGNTSKSSRIGFINTPGLYCRTIALAMVYGEATVSSTVLGRTQNFIAITGKELNGFFPVITGSGVRGWVMKNQVYPENSSLGPCRVQKLPDGKLLFGWP
ncbi:MAG: hypothetical protein ACRYG8_30465 [Janthinobacterium lividum]